MKSSYFTNFILLLLVVGLFWFSQHNASQQNDHSVQLLTSLNPADINTIGCSIGGLQRDMDRYPSHRICGIGSGGSRFLAGNPHDPTLHSKTRLVAQFRHGRLGPLRHAGFRLGFLHSCGYSKTVAIQHAGIDGQ